MENFTLETAHAADATSDPAVTTPTVVDPETPAAAVTGTVAAAAVNETAAAHDRYLLDRIVAAVHDAVIVLDGNGVIVFWGGGAETIYGYTTDDVLGRDSRILVDPRELADDEAARKAAHSKGHWRGTCRMRCADGTVIRVERSIRRIESPAPGVSDDTHESSGSPKGEGTNADGGPDRFIVVDRDDTVGHVTRNALLESELLLRSLADHMSAAYWIEDVTSGRAVLVSSGCERVFPCEKGPFAKNPQVRFDKLHPDDHGRVLGAVAERRIPYEIEYRLRDERGDRWIRERGFDVADAEGGATRRGVLAEDVTEERAAQQESEEHRGLLSHVARVSAMGEMASALAHELNQPLCAIANEAEACLRGVAEGTLNDEETLEGLQSLRDEAIRAGQIVRRVRRFVTKQAPERERIAPADLVLGVLDLVQPRLRAAQATVELHVDETAPPAILVDRVQIEQVLVNLVTNAVDAMGENPVADRRVTIEVHDRGNRCQFRVLDLGSGIPQESLDRVLEPYYSTKPEGMGMGLAICRTILESHGGRLFLDARRPRGTIVTFSLPMEFES